MHRLIKSGKFIVTIAACWAVAASLYIFFTPLRGQAVTSRRVFGNPSEVVETFITEQSWYEAQGLWGVCVLIIFAGLYLLAVRLAWQGRHVAVAGLSVLAIALSIVAGFSIGGAYLPAALGLFVAALLFGSSRWLGSR